MIIDIGLIKNGLKLVEIKDIPSLNIAFLKGYFKLPENIKEVKRSLALEKVIKDKMTIR